MFRHPTTLCETREPRLEFAARDDPLEAISLPHPALDANSLSAREAKERINGKNATTNRISNRVTGMGSEEIHRSTEAFEHDGPRFR